MYMAANPSREINRFLASQLLEMYSKIYASVVLARRESRLARRETRGGNLLLSGTVTEMVFTQEM